MKTLRYLFFCGLLITSMSVFSQNINIHEKIEEKTNSRADQRIDEGIDSGLDNLEQGIGSLFKKKQKNNTKESEGEEELSEEEEDQGESESENSQEEVSVVPQEKLKSFSKFDFIPGEKIIFYDDFSQDPIGEFPSKWDTNNNGEIVTINGLPGKWFQLPGDGGNYFPAVNMNFPDNITIEFDILFMGEAEFVFSYYSEEKFQINSYGVPGEAGSEVVLISNNNHNFSNYSTNETDAGREINSSSSKGLMLPGNLTHVSIWIQKSRFRLYIDEEKVFDVPKGVFNKFTHNRIRFNTTNSATNFVIGNMRIAVGSPDTRNQLITEGKFVTRGILFDSGSDVIKPESYACIKEIANVFKENSTISVTIIGHTDSDGDEAKNLDLSKRRALSVKKFLVSEFAIDAGCMQTDGKGESQPAMSNDTPEGKASNRRVEFIKN